MPGHDVTSRRWRPRTWMVELAVVAAALSSVVVATGGGWIEWVGAAAVALSFCHAQVADRLAEAEARRATERVEMPSLVHCHAWATRYLVGKESLWLLYFVAHRSWSALAGVGLFLAYPVWRRVWRTRRG